MQIESQIDKIHPAVSPNNIILLYLLTPICNKFYIGFKGCGKIFFIIVIGIHIHCSFNMQHSSELTILSEFQIRIFPKMFLDRLMTMLYLCFTVHTISRTHNFRFMFEHTISCVVFNFKWIIINNQISVICVFLFSLGHSIGSISFLSFSKLCDKTVNETHFVWLVRGNRWPINKKF